MGRRRRLLALAAVYDGATRTQAAEIGGVTLQIVRDWVVKFNAHGPDGLIDRKPPGQPSLLNDTHRGAIAAVIESGPIPAVHGVVRLDAINSQRKTPMRPIERPATTKKIKSTWRKAVDNGRGS
jgi:transposase